MPSSSTSIALFQVLFTPYGENVLLVSQQAGRCGLHGRTSVSSVSNEARPRFRRVMPRSGSSLQKLGQSTRLFAAAPTPMAANFGAISFRPVPRPIEPQRPDAQPSAVGYLRPSHLPRTPDRIIMMNTKYIESSTRSRQKKKGMADNSARLGGGLVALQIDQVARKSEPTRVVHAAAKVLAPSSLILLAAYHCRLLAPHSNMAGNAGASSSRWYRPMPGFAPHPPAFKHRWGAKLLGATMWFWIFYRAKQDGPVLLGLKHPWDGHDHHHGDHDDSHH
ncbi:hypothetical protein PaG_01313 [Moesziomyces aphidis]|uniref:Uncharacterized protein n=1 Tax=Moesziomyces aphidis TaxID=84754 RepID=W3VR80_MOEAP|nr:hypothetical protein PaG_01313 [Moesziomyces aphidis]